MADRVHAMTVRVYYEDTDVGGVVYHANFLRFMERGRTEWVRVRGVNQSELTDESGAPLAFVVRRAEVDFLRPGRMDDLLTVETRLDRRGGASFTMAQRVLRGDEVLVTASITIVLVGGGRPRRVSVSLASQLFGGLPDG